RAAGTSTRRPRRRSPTARSSTRSAPIASSPSTPRRRSRAPARGSPTGSSCWRICCIPTASRPPPGLARASWRPAFAPEPSDLRRGALDSARVAAARYAGAEDDADSVDVVAVHDRAAVPDELRHRRHLVEDVEDAGTADVAGDGSRVDGIRLILVVAPGE